MGRTPEGWRLRRHGARYYVRFSWQGQRPELPTGETDPSRAAVEAARIYARVISGQQPLKPAKGEGVPPELLPVDELLAAWIAAIETSYAASTVDLYRSHAFAHFEPRWKTLGEITQAAIGDYTRARLGQAARETVKKERNTLRAFLEWCVEKTWLPGLPLFPKIPKGATGTRDKNRKEEPTDLSPEEVEAWLAALPEVARMPSRQGVWKGRPFPVRDWFTLAWETGLRPGGLGALEVPRHYQRGAEHLRLTEDIDKVRFARPVPLTARARAILDRHAPASGLIWGSPPDLRHYIKAAAATAGLPPEKVATLSPYDLRHARATDLVDQTGDLAGTAYLLGHKQVTTTNRYAKGRLRHAEATLKQLDPASPASGHSGEDSGETGS